jgi:ATP-binding cassette subfamily B protein
MKRLGSNQAFFFGKREKFMEKLKIIKTTKAQQTILSIIIKHWFTLVLSIIIMISTTAIGIYLPVIVKHAIDENIMTKNFDGLKHDAVIFLIFLITLSLLTFFSIYITELFGQQFLFDLKQRLFDHILHGKIAIFDRHPVGRLISRIESDGESLREFFTHSVISILSDILLCIGMIIVLFRYSYSLTLLILPIIALIFIFSFWYQKSVAPFWVNLRKINSQLFGFFSDFIKGNSILRLFHKKPLAFNKVNQSLEKKYKNEIRGGLFDSIYFNSLQIFEAISISLILWYGGVKALSNKISIGTMILFVTYIKQFFGPIRNLSSQFQIFQKAFASVKRIDDVFEMEKEQIKNSNKKEFKEKITFENVSFAYSIIKLDEQYKNLNQNNFIQADIDNETNKVNEDENKYEKKVEIGNEKFDKETTKQENEEKEEEKLINALNDISFTIRKGEKVGIVGRTGCGKTTIASLLLKFYDGYKGSIKIDDMELSDISYEDIRTLIGAVFQDTFLFPDTIFSNIVLDSQISQQKVNQAIDELGVRAIFDNFVDGLNTVIKEDGTNISSGEKQLIALLRIYIKNPQIFLLDEATSSVDNITENLIYEALEKILKNRTAIIIAHRLSTIEFCDRILCFHQGHLVETGTKEELLEKGGYFANLYKSYKDGQTKQVVSA